MDSTSIITDSVPHIDHGKTEIKVGLSKSADGPEVAVDVKHPTSASKVGVPNIVTAVLASYRGYDTLGETVVIFTAGIGVLLLLRGRRRQRVGEAAA